jgi:heme-degrading monooxygenase HmoA
MAVLIRHRNKGMGRSDYDQVAPPLVEKLKTQPGFVLHVAFEDDQGFCVAEVWESQDEHDAWFDENVVPNVPGEITQEVIPLHAVHQP